MNNRGLIVNCINLIAVFFFLNISSTKAQNNTSNPYSMYGLGELRSQTNAATAAMGNAGIGLASTTFLNALNPASYTGLDSLNFLFEIGVDGKYSKFKSQGESANTTDGNLSYLALGWRINKRVAAGFGINPFSNSGYEINSTEEIEGTTIKYPFDIIGSGNISRVYVNLAFALSKNLSLGVKPSFIFGSLEQNQYHDLRIIGSSPVNNITKNYFHNFFFEFGVQYTLNLKPGDLTIGAVYNPGASMVTKREDTTYDDAGNVYENKKESEDNFRIPEEYGLGLAFKNRKNLVCVLDAGIQKWSGHNYDLKELTDLTGVRLKDNPYVRTGLEFTPTQNYLAKFYKRVNYRVGFQYAKSYLDLRGTRQHEIAVSLGFGLPLKNQLSRIDVTFEGGQNGTTDNNLIEERFLRIRIGFSMRDLWFQHRRYN